MGKNKISYVCNNCGSISQKWSGKCMDCGEWGTIEEDNSTSSGYSFKAKKGNNIAIESLASPVKESTRTKTPIKELNRVLGGGLVAGSAILIGGDPGIGKSTLLLQLSAQLTSVNLECLYITGEESTEQVKLRGQRLGLAGQDLQLMSATCVEDIITTLDKVKNQIKLVVIDSIQTMFVANVSSAPGTVSQIRTSAHELISYAKKNNIILMIVGHVTKDGQIAGPKVLEHMVDTVLYFEGDRGYHFRILRAIKNRFGGINEIGVFEMQEQGLIEVSNPSKLFLMDRDNNVSGTSVFPGIEGSRPVLMEVQALLAPTNMATPRRSVVGWDHNRLSMILAVLAVRFGLDLSSYEVYLSIAGGLRITEPAADLAVAGAIISAAQGRPMPDSSVLFGEIGLSGEVRKVSQATSRINEALKLGFKHIICSHHEEVKMDDASLIGHIKQLKNLI